MASATIDQLKKSLREQGIALPPAGSKKADYVKLYEQYSTLNENLGDFYSSDDENPPRNSSQHISSSTSPSKIENVMKEVERLTDDELYNQLKELGASIGPVLKNTRKVYERKLVKILGGGGGGGGSQKNGIDGRATNTFKVDEFSDSEVELPPVKTYARKVEHKESSMPRSPRKGSVTRESPKPSFDEPAPDPPVIDRKFAGYGETSKAPTFRNYEREGEEETTRSSKFSFIETIPKGSSYRFIEPALPTEVDFPSAPYQSTAYPSSTSIRSRFNAEKSSFDRPTFEKPTFERPTLEKPAFDRPAFEKPSLAQGDYYTGTWEPNMKKYFASTQSQSKMSKRATTPSLTTKSHLKENLIAVTLVVLFIVFLLYLHFYHWSVDPYKEIEDDADKELEHLTARSLESESNI